MTDVHNDFTGTAGTRLLETSSPAGGDALSVVNPPNTDAAMYSSERVNPITRGTVAKLWAAGANPVQNIAEIRYVRPAAVRGAMQYLVQFTGTAPEGTTVVSQMRTGSGTQATNTTLATTAVMGVATGGSTVGSAALSTAVPLSPTDPGTWLLIDEWFEQGTTATNGQYKRRIRTVAPNQAGGWSITGTIQDYTMAAGRSTTVQGTDPGPTDYRIGDFTTTTTTLPAMYVAWFRANDGATGFLSDPVLSAAAPVVTPPTTVPGVPEIVTQKAGVVKAVVPYARVNGAWVRLWLGSGDPQVPTDVPPGPNDTEGPTAPGQPTLLAAGVDYLDVQWAPATDNVGIWKYRIRVAKSGGNPQYYRDIFAPAGGGPVPTSARISGREPGTAYSVIVQAYDNAGNQGPASDIGTLTTLGSATLASYGALLADWDASALADGAVASWAPSDGTFKANVIPTQATLTRQPVKSVKAGNPVVTFDGGDWVQAGTSTFGQAPSVGLTAHAAVDIPAGSAGTDRVLFIRSGSNNGRFSIAFIDGKPSVGGRRLDTDAFQTITGTTSVAGLGRTVVSFQTDYAGGLAKLWINGTPDVSTTFQTAGPASTNASSDTTIGARNDGIETFAGDLMRLAIYDGVQTAQQVADTVKALGANTVTPPPPPPPPTGLTVTASESEAWWWSTTLLVSGTQADPLAEYQVWMDDRPFCEVTFKGLSWTSPHLEAGPHTFKVRKRLTTTPVVTTNPDGTTTTTYTYTYTDWSSVTYVTRDWPTPTGSQLMWPTQPKNWSATPIIKNMTSGTLRIEAPGDYEIRLPSTPINLPAGDRRGEIYCSLPTGTAGQIRYRVVGGQINAQPDNPMTLKLTGHGDSGVWAFIQGLDMTGDHEGDVFHVDLRTKNSMLVLQNVRGARIRGRQTGGQHADQTQLIGGPKTLLIDCFEGNSDYQMFFWDPKKFDSMVNAEPGLYGTYSVTRVDAKMYGQTLIPSSGSTSNLGKAGIPFYSIHDWDSHMPKIKIGTVEAGTALYARRIDATSFGTPISNGAPLYGGDQKPGIWLGYQRDVAPPGGTVLRTTPGLNYVSPGSAPIPARP